MWQSKSGQVSKEVCQGKPTEHTSLALQDLISHLDESKKYRLLDLSRSLEQNFAFFSKFCCQQRYEDLTTSIIEAGEVTQQTWSELSDLGTNKPFDIILCWDLLAYLNDNELERLDTALSSCSHAETKMLYFRSTGEAIPSTPGYFTIKASNKLSYQNAASTKRPNTFPSLTKMSKLFPQFQRKRSFLLRHGVEEVLTGATFAPPRIVTESACSQPNLVINSSIEPTNLAITGELLT